MDARTGIEYAVCAVAYFYAYNVFEWALHRLSHRRTTLPGLRVIYQAHMDHHKAHYPVDRLIRPAPYVAGQKTIYALAPCILAIWAAAWRALRWDLFVLFFVESFVLLQLGDYLHQQYHIESSWLEKSPLLGKWFAYRRAWHFYHHGHLASNMSLGGMTEVVDVALGTGVQVDVGARAPGEVPLSTQRAAKRQ